MMIRKYNVLSVPFFAFFSKKAYRDVGKNWKGVNLAYLFLLMAVCCLPPAIALRKTIVNHLEKNQMHMINQIPDIQIENGRVTIDQRQPYYITRKDGSPAIILDTTGSMNYIDDPQVFALLMESSLIVRSGANTFKTFDLSTIDEFHLDRYIASNWLQMTKDALVPVSYSVFLLLSYIFAVFVMLLAAIFGLVMSKVMRGTISFASALRIATIAATPSILFITLSTTMGIDLSEGIHLGVTLVYLFVGIKTCAKAEEDHIDLKSCLHEEELAGLENAA